MIIFIFSGYPANCWDKENFRATFIRFELRLSEEEMKDKVRKLYSVLLHSDFQLFTMNQQRQLELAPFSSMFFKEKKYAGTVVIKICDTT